MATPGLHGHDKPSGQRPVVRAPRAPIAMARTSAAACSRAVSTPAYQDELAPPPPEEPPPPDQELELELLLDHEDEEEEEL